MKKDVRSAQKMLYLILAKLVLVLLGFTLKILNVFLKNVENILILAQSVKSINASCAKKIRF